MLNVRTEQLKDLTEASKSLPGRPHVSTLWRWYRHGVRGVKLETVVIGGRRYTSVEALQRFAERLSSPRAELSPPVADSRQEQIGAQLDAAGF